MFCEPCLLSLGGGEELYHAVYLDQWACFLCRPNFEARRDAARVERSLTLISWQGSLKRRGRRQVSDLRKVSHPALLPHHCHFIADMPPCTTSARR